MDAAERLSKFNHINKVRPLRVFGAVMGEGYFNQYEHHYHSDPLLFQEAMTALDFEALLNSELDVGQIQRIKSKFDEHLSSTPFDD